MSTYLLVWDAPNMDMGLGSLLGGRPTAAHRPRFDVIGRWLVYRAVDVDADPQAAVFTNVSPGGADVIRPWVEAIRNVGFGVFAKPKIHEDDDVDPDMIDHIEKLRDDLAGVAHGIDEEGGYRRRLRRASPVTRKTVAGQSC